MAGLIGQAISNIGSTIGNYMMQANLQEDRQEERRREREEDARRQAERDALYRRTADQQTAAAAARSSGGGGNSREYTPEEQAVMAVASGRFGSQGDVDKFKSAVKTGDYSGYKQDITKTRYEEGFQGAADAVQETVKDYPPGFEREVQAKANVLANITRESVQGKNLDDVNKGRRTQQEIEGTDLALREPGKAGLVGQSMAAGAGKPLVDVKDGTAFNQYTAANAPTKKGESEIAENLAQARKALADASRPGGATGGQQEKLATMLTSLSKILENPEISEKDRKAVGALQMQIANAISTTVDARVPGSSDPKPGAPKEIPAAAIADLAKDPSSARKTQFDAIFGKGAADQALAKKSDAPAPAPASTAKPAGAPAPKPAPASEPPDSPSAKFKARQAEIKQKQADWESEQAKNANAAFQALDMSDLQAAARLQDSPLFSYLTREQKAAVRKAVMGR